MDDELVTRENAQSRTCSLPECAHPKCHDARTIIALYDRAEQAEERVAELEAERDRYRPFVEWKAQSPCCCDMVLSGGQCDACKAREAMKGTEG